MSPEDQQALFTIGATLVFWVTLVGGFILWHSRDRILGAITRAIVFPFLVIGFFLMPGRGERRELQWLHFKLRLLQILAGAIGGTEAKIADASRSAQAIRRAE